MAEVGFARRVAPALVLAALGGLLLYLLPSGGDTDTADVADSTFPEDTSAAPASGATTSPGSSAPASGSPANSKRVIQGDVVNFKYGTLQVKIALEGTTLVNIAVITAPGGSYQQYTQLAVPEMKAKIIAAQSTKVAAASGATYTSEAYAQSVQSALDKA